jgi:aryl-alcohol dehydrogenase-like predicted oxidoreductase
MADLAQPRNDLTRVDVDEARRWHQSWRHRTTLSSRVAVKPESLENLVELRKCGRTGLEISVLGFGCGAVGGLMVRGNPSEQERAVGRALELGINFFDTAPMYGDGESERNIGRILKNMRSDAFIGTKVWLTQGSRRDIGGVVTSSLEASLGRLGRNCVDLLQFHNPIAESPRDDALEAGLVIDEIVPIFERLRRQGKTRFCGITGLGSTPAILRVIDSRLFDTVQVAYNLLNPSAGAIASGLPGQDFGDLLQHASEAGMGTIGIRTLAGGALSGAETRHPNGLPIVDAVGTSDYPTDVRHAKLFQPLVREGHAGSLVEAAIRFVIANSALTTAMIGCSSIEQLEFAAAAANKGPLTPNALARVTELQKRYGDEAT